MIAFSVTDTGIGIPTSSSRSSSRPSSRPTAAPAGATGHRPGPVDQPRDRAPAGRRPDGRELARARQHLHAVPAARLRRGRGRARRAGLPLAATPAPAARRRRSSRRRAPRSCRRGRGRAAGRPPRAAHRRSGRCSSSPTIWPWPARLVNRRPTGAGSRRWSRSAEWTGSRWGAPIAPTPSRSTWTPADRGGLAVLRPAQARRADPPRAGPAAGRGDRARARPAGAARSPAEQANPGAASWSPRSTGWPRFLDEPRRRWCWCEADETERRAVAGALRGRGPRNHRGGGRPPSSFAAARSTRASTASRSTRRCRTRTRAGWSRRWRRPGPGRHPNPPLRPPASATVRW